MSDEEEHPVRRVTDAAQLRAMAHPLRFTLMELLLLDGPATATELAAKVGESPANCSWHLRQLEKHGYITEGPKGPGRRRPWQAVVQSHTTDLESEEDPDYASAVDAFNVVNLKREIGLLDAWFLSRRTDDPRWREAAGVVQSLMWLTPEELSALQEDLVALVSRHMDRLADPERRPEGAALVRFVGWGIPARPAAAAQPPGPAAPEAPEQA